MNEYFSSVPSLLNAQIERNTPFDVPGANFAEIFPSNGQVSSVFFGPVTEHEIAEHVNKLKIGKSPGEDQITAKLIKACYPHIKHVLVYIANLMLSQSIFPTALKTAKIIAIPKSESATQPHQFRPISLISGLSKVLENVIKIRIQSFYTRTQFFCNSQFGFTEGKSTEDALLDFTQHVYTGINFGKKMSALFLDITKAFDTIDHELLLQALELSGIRGGPLMLLKSYLTERTQCVSVKTALSSRVITSYGTPQGSTLGPILFLVLINGFCKGRFRGRVTSFCDDTALTYEGDRWEENMHNMQIDLNYIRLWFDTNSLTLSSTKTQYMHLHLRHEEIPPLVLNYHSRECLNTHGMGFNMQVCGCPKICQTKEVRYLGLIVDELLTWNTHISQCQQKLKFMLRTFYFLRNICSTDTCLQVFHALVQSRLTYAILIYGGTYPTRLRPLVLLQKHFVRVILKKNRVAPSLPLFKQIDILPLKHFYVFKVLKLYYLRSGNSPSGREIETRTRQNATYVVPRPYNEFFKRTYLYTGPLFFNILPDNIKYLQTIKSFCKSCKGYLLESDGRMNLYSL